MEQRIRAILSDSHQAIGEDVLAELLAIVDERPTFVFLAALLLRRSSSALPPERLERLRAMVALGAADRAAMLDLADMSGMDWSHFYPRPKAPEKKTTTDTIDDFIETYGHSSPEEDRLIEKLIFNPVAPDYFQGLDQPLDPSDPLALPPELSQKPEPAPTGAVDEACVPQAIRKATPPVFRGVQPISAPPKDAPTETAAIDPQPAPESPLLMESLAKIFIKQRRYERALEIISKLSLNNPEKSVYFADQIRFLQKLVYNDRKKNQSKTIISNK